jgi:hypothetical protein
MAKIVLKDVVIVLNSVDFSDHADSVTIESEFDEVESSAFGAVFKEYQVGLGDATITVGMQQDFAAGEVDATLWPLAIAGTSFAVAIKPTSAAISATNPEYQMTARLYGYSPLDGSIGDLSTTEITLRNASTTGLVRDTTP